MFKCTGSSGCHRRSRDHGIQVVATRLRELLRTPTGRFRAPGPRYWIGPANAGCVSHHETCRGADVTPHSLLRCLRIILTAEHRASNWPFCARKEISVRRWVSLVLHCQISCELLVFLPLLFLPHNYQRLPSTNYL